MEARNIQTTSTSSGLNFLKKVYVRKQVAEFDELEAYLAEATEEPEVDPLLY